MSAPRGTAVIREAFATARAEGRAALIPYITLGYPTPERSFALAEAAIEGGADLLELGIPFSDPLADGPVIQRATQGALAAGTTVRVCLELAARLRRRHPWIPLLFMGYLNPLLAFGERAFCRACRKAGVDGLIIPDLPPDEAEEIEARCRDEDLATVYLAAPNTPEERLRMVCARSSSYVYLVSLTGTTGPRAKIPEGLPEFVARVRGLTGKPVAIGFGIATADQAAAAARIADGVIVGSAVVNRCDGGQCEERVRAFVADLRAAVGRDSLRAEEHRG